jgi:uncharacterized protein YcbK (DUF882 family)
LRKSIWFAALLFASTVTLGAAHADEQDAQRPTPATSSTAKGKGKRKRRAKAVFSGRLASAEELRDDPLDRPSGKIELYAVNFGETVSVNIYNEDGTYNADALDQLNHFWRCKRTGTEKAIDPRLYAMLSRIYDHFGKRIELISGFRNQKRTSSFHFHGSASDIRIAGVDEKVVHKYVESLDTGGMGIGIYPRGHFVHVDIRPEPSYRWVDYSPPGTSDMGHPHKKRKPQPNT